LAAQAFRTRPAGPREILLASRIVRSMRTISSGAGLPDANPIPHDVSSSESLIEEILRELRGALRELRCGTTERIIRQGISMTQFHVLWLLEHHGELPMSRLAELLAVSLSNTTGLVDRMEERGLVARRRVPDDRRLVVVAIGPEGLRLLRELEEVHHDRLRGALASLDADRLARVHEAFSDFRTVIEADLRRTSHAHAIDPAATVAAPSSATPSR
jgi:DNA-binding MarR family transcriptional regulator